MLISVLTSSLLCLSKVQFHMCSFPRSNCQFLEHRHFTTHRKGKKTIADSSRYNLHLPGRDKRGRVCKCTIFTDDHIFCNVLCTHCRNVIYRLHFLSHHQYPDLFVSKILVEKPSFFYVYLYPSAPPECTTAFVRMFFSCKIPFWILLHFVPSLVKVAC